MVKERQGLLEVAAEQERLRLLERRAMVAKVETITSYARDMWQFLRKRTLTEKLPFIRSLPEEIVVEPGKAAIRYTIPMPQDSPIGDRDSEELPLRSPVLSAVTDGGPVTNINTTNFVTDVADDVLASGSMSQAQRPVQNPGSVPKSCRRGELYESH